MLEPIVESTRGRIETLRGGLSELRAMAEDAPPPRSLATALTEPGISVIAEVKRRSPSRGNLAPALDPVERATSYAAGGAAAVSVLTEPHHFSGSNDDLIAVRDAVGVPVLRKDFTLDPLQVWEARAIGADAVLLILAILVDDVARSLLESAEEAGLDALVEVHTEQEAERALGLGPRIVGVNNRDLTTFEVDLATAERLAPMLAEVPVTVAESGVHRADDSARMRQAGFDAVLVGEALVRADDPTALVGELRGIK